MPDLPTLESAVNVSEGSDAKVIQLLVDACGNSLLDVHSDSVHNRSVFTLAGPQVELHVRQLARQAVELLDLGQHQGVHPRLGAIDVVPFIPLPMTGATMDDARVARDSFAQWIGAELGVPAFVYGAERTLPDIRRYAFNQLAPDYGPAKANPARGACAVGARSYLIAYNLWLRDTPLAEARTLVKQLRGPAMRCLAFAVGDAVQISCNLIDPLGDEGVDPESAYDAVARLAPIERAELVGLIPKAVLDGIPEARWDQLDLSPHKIIEARLTS